MRSPRRHQGRTRVRVANSSDGGFWYWLVKLYGFALVAVLAVILAAVLAVYGTFARTAPPVPDLAEYSKIVPGVSRMYAADGSLLGELAEEWREVVPYERLPKKLVQAFLAAEDHEFFAHDGLYPRGIIRAAWRNATSGEFAQGGSTITQQVAKQFLGAEKTLARKVKEAIIARRLEARYSKEEILNVYLNHIFLGSGAYGVQAAAKRYFSKDVTKLDLGEMATIAGLAQAPSKDSPLSSLEHAKKRRDTVLEKMARHGFISDGEAEEWQARPIVLAPRKDVFLTTEPYFAEHVRRTIKEKYGQDALMKQGLTIETTAWPWVEAVAYENVDWNTRKHDKRQGYRGPEAHLTGTAAQVFLTRARDRYGDGPLASGQRYLGLVESVTPGQAMVRVGTRLYRLPLRNMSWAAKWSRTDSTNDRQVASVTEALRPGDVAWVSPLRQRIRPFSDWTYDDHYNAHWLPSRELTPPAFEVTLEQVPHVQGAILTIDHQNGYVVAMVGGQDFARSEFNRAVQACRQPGSTYKPIYYSTALDRGYSFDTLLNDIPKAEVDPVTGEVWVPVNLHGTVDFQVTLEYALVFSKNVPSVDLFSKLGAKEVEKWARRLGFTSQIIADKALALGASCTYMDELSRALAILARNGRWLDLVYVRRVLDRNGQVLEDNTSYDDEALAPRDRLDRLAKTCGTRPREAIPARAAYLTSKLLRAVVTHGYSSALRAIGIPSAGKTGTSSATMDLWFVAYTSRWLTSTWLGDDLRQRPIGMRDAAFMSTVPMWARYMKEVSEGQPLEEIPWETPAGVKPGDRGGARGKSAEAPMPLVPHQKVKSLDAPPGVFVPGGGTGAM
ncbi:MAG: transglycosylase domain-containing protein [Deltaproteobacteria bacterium]|nr:transglycosylase domain-containing protein [Deltaproteobacteria bacterium]